MQNNKLNENIDKAKINIYNLLAVLIVIIPELFAEIIYEIGISQHNNELPTEGDAWRKDSELKLSRMNILELRLTAKSLSIHGYSNEDRNSLIRRIIRRYNKKKRWETLNKKIIGKKI